MTLSFRKHGSGEPIVILHGLLGSGENWHSFALRLAKKFEVFLPDLRNHGRSPHTPGMTYPQLADDVAEFIDRVVSPPAYVLGHSMGGKVGMQLALQYPERVRSLQVVDIGPQEYPPFHRPIINALLSLNLAACKSRKEMEQALEKSVPSLVTRRFLLKNVGQAGDGRFHWKIGLKEIDDAYEDLSRAVSGVRSFGGPVLFLKGDLSDYLSIDDMPRIQNLFPAAVLKTIPRAGHWVQVENPNALLAAVLDFLQPTADPFSF